MANNTASNITRKVLEQFLVDMESQRVLSKTVNTQAFKGKFTPSSGDYVDIKRPHRYLAKRTAAGDISGGTVNSIISGKATATVQNYITVDIDWTNKEEALSLNQLKEITMPAAEECVTELENSFGEFMINNAGLAYGAPDTVVDAWSDIAGAMAYMKSIGVPSGELYYAMNPYTAVNLASKQSALAPGSDGKLVRTAWEQAQISSPFAGMRAITTDSLSNRTSSTMADRAGALTGAPTATYVSVKDTMTQTWAVTGFTASSTLKAGEILEVTGRYYIHQKTRNTFVDGAGDAVKFRAIVTEDVTLDGSGAGNVVVSAAAILESNGQYNTVDSALTTSDVITVLGTSATLYQPNLFYHKDAFSIAFVQLPKLYSTDTNVVTKDGLAMRVSKYANGSTNVQSMRIDLLPAFAVLNPFFAGHGHGV